MTELEAAVEKLNGFMRLYLGDKMEDPIRWYMRMKAVENSDKIDDFTKWATLIHEGWNVPEYDDDI